MAGKTFSNFSLAVIGAGIHAETNVFPSLANHLLADVQKKAVCDLDEAKARRMAALCGCGRTYTDYREMIRKEHPDGVIVCLNGSLHPEVVTTCVAMGVPVLVEKPPALTVEDAIKMREASRSNRCPVMVAHQKRHGTAYNFAREIAADTKEFGRVVQIEAKMHGMPRFPTNFGCLMEWQIHNIDLIRSFAGDIEDITVRSLVMGVRKAAVTLLLKFAGGAVAAVGWGTFGGPGPFCERIEVVGDKGKGVIVENAYDVTWYDGSWCRRWRPDWNPNLANQSQVLMGYVGEIRHFVECVQKKKQPSPSIDDGVKNLQALYEIARQMGIPPRWRFTPSRF
jgi:myo-inositol 2-dehydrogenase / D-chiro-inositol 1-dehydrogenase